ncbi:MAG: MATE family efflux transporter [Phocaeicola sp.]
MTHRETNHINSQEREFATASVGYLFRKYAVAGALGLMFVGMQTMIDGAFLGNYVGPNALAAVNLVMPIYTIITAIAIVIGIGCQTVVSISLGEGNRQKGADALCTAFIAMLAIVSLLATLFYLFTDQILYVLGDDLALFEYSKAYFTTFIPFFPFIALFFLADYMMKALGKPYFAMLVLTGTVVLNILLDYLFIGILSLETIGAAYATGISFSLGALAVSHILFRNSSQITIQQGKFKLKLLGKMIYNGSSEGLSELSAGITILLFNNAMIYYVGAHGVAAYTFINYLIYIGIIIFVGVSDGIIPILSYNYGAKNYTRMLTIFRYAVVVNGSIGCLFALAAFFAGGEISALFFTADIGGEEVINIATIGSKICAFAFLINGINIAISSLFTSMGDAKTSIIISLLRGLIFIAIGITIFPKIGGVDGIWLTIPVAELLTLLIAMPIFLFRKKKVLNCS